MGISIGSIGKAIQGAWDDITGTSAARKQQKGIQEAGAATQGAYNTYADAMKQAYGVMEPYARGGYEQAQKTLAEQLGLYGGAQQQALQALQGGQAQAAQSAKDAAAKQEALVREGMGMDRATLQAMLSQALGMQSGASGAYGQLLSTALPALLGAARGTSQMPLSSAAQLQMGDTTRQLQAAMQRQGLGGSGMEAAQLAAARRRVAAEDEQRQYERMWQMLQTGLTGQQGLSNLVSQYAGPMGQLGSRLSQVKPADLTELYYRGGQNIADIYGNTASRQAQAMQAANLPSQYQSLGQFYGQQIMNPAQARLQGTLGLTQANAQASQIQGPSFLQSVGDIAKIVTGLSGLGGGGGSYGYFGSPGSWSSEPYSYGYRGVGPLK